MSNAETVVNEIEDAIVPIGDIEKIKQALTYWESVENIEIKNQEQYDNALEVCKELKRQFKDLDSRREELKAPWANKANEVQASFNDALKPLKNGEKKLKSAMGAWYAEEQIRIAEEERKREAEAEAKRRREAEKAEAELEKAKQYEEQGREEMAEKAEARAEAAMNKAATIVAPVVESKVTGKGASFAKKYKCEVTDKRAFLKYALETNGLYLQHVEIQVKPFEALQKHWAGELEVPGLAFKPDYTVGVKV